MLAHLIVATIAFSWFKFSHSTYARSKIPNRKLWSMMLDVGIWGVGLCFLWALREEYILWITGGIALSGLILLTQAGISYLERVKWSLK